MVLILIPIPSFPHFKHRLSAVSKRYCGVFFGVIFVFLGARCRFLLTFFIAHEECYDFAISILQLSTFFCILRGNNPKIKRTTICPIRPTKSPAKNHLLRNLRSRKALLVLRRATIRMPYYRGRLFYSPAQPQHTWAGFKNEKIYSYC